MRNLLNIKCDFRSKLFDKTQVWWKGECGYTWKAKVRDRTRAKSPGCPYCSGRRKPERPIRLD